MRHTLAGMTKAEHDSAGKRQGVHRRGRGTGRRRRRWAAALVLPAVLFGWHTLWVLGNNAQIALGLFAPLVAGAALLGALDASARLRGRELLTRRAVQGFVLGFLLLPFIRLFYVSPVDGVRDWPVQLGPGVWVIPALILGGVVALSMLAVSLMNRLLCGGHPANNCIQRSA